jgi:4-amino-4-deoxy-L-arabinose transferase-like glycosyltransferase
MFCACEQQSEAVGSRRSSYRFLLFVVVAACALRFVVVALAYRGFLDPERNNWLFGFEVGSIARSIVSGHGFANPFWVPSGPTAWVTPVYPYVVAGIFDLLGIQTTAAAIAILALNSFLSALTCVPIFFIAKRMFGDAVARLAVLLWALFPYSVFFSANSMWYHSLLALEVATLFLLSLSLAETDDTWPWVAFGVLFGVAALTNPVVLAGLPALLGWPLYRRRQTGKKFGVGLLAAALLSTAIVTPWVVRNLRTFPKAVFLKDNFWIEVAVGNVADDVHWWNSSIHPAGSAAEVKSLRELGETEYLAGKRQQALTFIREHPMTFVLRSCRRAIYFWTGYWSLSREYLQQEPMDPWSILVCANYSLLVALGLIRLFRQQPETAAPFLLLLLVYPLVYYVTHPEFSYRLPLDTLGIIIVSYFAVSVRSARTARASAPELVAVVQLPELDGAIATDA